MFGALTFRWTTLLGHDLLGHIPYLARSLSMVILVCLRWDVDVWTEAENAEGAQM